MRHDYPILVDVNYGKAQRSLLLGSIWTAAIAAGIGRGLRQIQSGSNLGVVQSTSLTERIKESIPLPHIGAI